MQIHIRSSILVMRTNRIRKTCLLSLTNSTHSFNFNVKYPLSEQNFPHSKIDISSNRNHFPFQNTLICPFAWFRNLTRSLMNVYQCHLLPSNVFTSRTFSLLVTELLPWLAARGHTNGHSALCTSRSILSLKTQAVHKILGSGTRPSCLQSPCDSFEWVV